MIITKAYVFLLADAQNCTYAFCWLSSVYADNYFIVMVTALEVTLFPAPSVTMQRTCILFQVALAVAVVDAVVCPFHLVHAVCPFFLKYHW